ncbi:hypothetical protein EWV36_04180 [Staphylococcus pseudintermedius]|nr:hypothetical protein EWV36_04180 [Staphylococcus pseudintermedius]
MSSLTSAGARRKSTSRICQQKQAAAAHQLFKDHPEFISATVTVKLMQTVRHYVSGSLSKDYLYGYVMDK